MIIGTALIVLTWVLFYPMGLHIALSVVLTVVGAFIILFGLTFGIYFFNLDMKLTSKLYPLFQKHYDKIKRNHKI